MRKICYNDKSRLALAMPVFEEVESSPSKCEFAGCVVDCRNLKIYQWDSARRLRRGLRRADFKKLSNQLTPPLLIECRRREVRLRREIRSFSHVLWIWSRCSYGKSRNHGMSRTRAYLTSIIGFSQRIAVWDKGRLCE
ncbi:hypothetical protein K443DRAFT_686260 [Laccaria amethystina LaAM-08-1]|uniref:Uncharacterized protein n=1 Tax=Laccaria amethystina LaAM-08-1 TaxID=1095629 RepID=A0A0C9X0T3_9AGAR|nr:hypothetical protein K443DRAFT_686260 [Laccaria amethystina LaAM-08-1]